MSSLPPDYKFLADTNPFLTKSKATARAVRPRELHLNHSTDSISSPKHTEPFIIGVAGGTASGKTTVCDEIVSALSNKRVAIIAQDSFYRSLTPAEKDLANRQEYNFDHPDAFDNDLLEKTLVDLRKGKPVQIPVYDFKTHSRLDESITISGADVIIIEGILVLASVGLRNTMHMKVFVDTDADTRLARRIVRDIKERARDLSSVLDQYEKFVKPSFDDYVMPTKKWADIIIPRGGDNTVAIDLLVQHIKLKLGERDRSHDAFFLE